MFEKRVLRRIFGLKRGEVTGGWRKLHNEELHNLYFLLYNMEGMKPRRMGGDGREATVSNILSQ
jgi:hypothetical protein